jgi:hypothetical protein
MVGYPKQIVSGYPIPKEGKEEFVSFLFWYSDILCGVGIELFLSSSYKKVPFL